MVQESPTFMGWMEKINAWGFSPTANALRNCDRVWDVSKWDWESVQNFMNLIPDASKINYLLESETPEITSGGN